MFLTSGSSSSSSCRIGWIIKVFPAKFELQMVALTAADGGNRRGSPKKKENIPSELTEYSNGIR